MRNVFLLTLPLVFFAVTAVEAAQLGDVSGDVLVNAGKGFVPADARESMALKPGDKILVRDNSFATVSFSKCAIALTEPTVFTVTKSEPCEKSAALPEESLVISPTATDGGSLAGEAQVVGMAVSAAIVVGAGAVLVDTLTDDDPVSGN